MSELQKRISWLEKVIAGRIPVMELLGLAYTSVKKTARQYGYKTRAAWLKGIGKASVVPLTDAVSAELVEFFPDAPEDEESDGADPPNADPGTGLE